MRKKQYKLTEAGRAYLLALLISKCDETTNKSKKSKVSIDYDAMITEYEQSAEMQEGSIVASVTIPAKYTGKPWGLVVFSIDEEYWELCGNYVGTMITLIACMDLNRGIGYKGELLYKLSYDQRHFNSTTKGHAVIMGGVTERLFKRPLAGRHNIVLTRNTDMPRRQGFIYVSTVDEAIKVAKEYSEDIFVIGGGEIYKLFLPLANKVILTIVEENDLESDTFFPELNPYEWDCVKQQLGGSDKEDLFLTIRTYKRWEAK